jgi:DNA (cytosine-5)-methyltransferase 1
MSINLALHRPECFTKELKLQTLPGNERRLRISSNLLDLMGFGPQVRYERRVLAPGAGFELRASTAGDKQVYRRTYASRRNNPTETVIDDRNQDFLRAAIPGIVERVHLTMRDGCIIGRPVHERTFHIRKAFRDPTHKLGMFAAMSSGVDAYSFGAAGFEALGLLDFRPIEKRDIIGGRVKDLTETGILTALANNPFKFVFNEDVFRMDFARIAEALKGQQRPAVLILSPQCDEFSNLKARSLREASVENLDTTFDMAYECLRLIETLEPATVMIENVPQFGSSMMAQLVTTKLRRWGYNVTADVYDARKFGGATGRRRWLCVGSIYPNFEAPTGLFEPEAGRVWALIQDQIPFCRDVTDTSTMQAALACGRARLITSESASAGTITKSEAHGAKDALRILTPEGRYLVPNETILRRLQGIPDGFNLDAVSHEVAVEQIGQSVDVKMHDAFAMAIRRHIALNRGEALPATIQVPSLRRPASVDDRARVEACMQLPLFN